MVEVSFFSLFFVENAATCLLKLLARRHHNLYSKPSTASTSAGVQLFHSLPPIEPILASLGLQCYDSWNREEISSN